MFYRKCMFTVCSNEGEDGVDASCFAKITECESLPKFRPSIMLSGGNCHNQTEDSRGRSPVHLSNDASQESGSDDGLRSRAFSPRTRHILFQGW